MKRGAVALMLVIIACAAFLLLREAGLFRRPEPGFGVAPGFGGSPGFGGAPGLGGFGAPQQTEYAGGTGLDNEPGLPVMTPAEIDKVIRSWSYPGAVDATADFIPRGTAIEAASKQWGKYTRFLKTFDPPGKVWAFYSAKADADSPANTLVPSAPGHPLASQAHSFANSMSMPGARTGYFGKSTKSYIVTADLMYQAGQSDTRIILSFAPAKKMLAGTSGNPGEATTRPATFGK